MITVKKDAIKYKDANGQMQSAGVLCSVGILESSSGEQIFKYLRTLESSFNQAAFPNGICINIKDIEFYTSTKKSCCNTFDYSTGLKKVVISGNTKRHSMEAQYMFRATDVEEIDFSNFNALFTNITAFAASCRNLKNIKGILDITGCSLTSSAFNNCTNLEEIRFKEQCIACTISFVNSSKLSDASIQSIIDGLTDLTGQTAKTLTFYSEVKSKLTDAQIATITEKNWTVA